MKRRRKAEKEGNRKVATLAKRNQPLPYIHNIHTLWMEEGRTGATSPLD